MSFAHYTLLGFAGVYVLMTGMYWVDDDKEGVVLSALMLIIALGGALS